MKMMNRRGDTLIEVIFALAILASILTVVTSGGITAWRTSRAAGERAQAAALATEQSESLRALRQAYASWSSFRTEVNGYDEPFHMAVDPVGGSGWKTASGDTSRDQYRIKVVRTGPVNIATSQLDFEITVEWTSPGSSQLNRSSQSVSLAENR